MSELAFSTQSQDYRRGALAFKSLLIELENQHGQTLEKNPGEYVHFPIYAPGIRSRFEEAAMNSETNAGFWDAFAVFLGLFAEGTFVIPDHWDVLSDLAEEHGQNLEKNPGDS
jgi:hypothetical protein